ncbi:hypothetical protein K1719_034797 [Acacia pycnantha]|nr:hypothetical protein K1719_034797 [Acacia pycnantha]
MLANPEKWSWEEHEVEILTKHIGYNIGDCDFMFGPTLHLDHWFCHVLEMKTMHFYALDSLVDPLTYLRFQNLEEDAMKEAQQTYKSKKKNRKQEEESSCKELLASYCVSITC